MIIDKLSNSELYEFKNQGIKRAIEFIKSADFDSVPDCRSEIDGDNIYVIKSTYKTKNKSDVYPEAHRDYVDVQFIISGTEAIGYAANTSQKIYKEYEKDYDYELYDAECSYIEFCEGMFAVFFPGELHKPGILSDDKPAEVRKIVVKVKV